ncbi:VWA domain-containing protein [Phytohabitans sp. ZYX-F-186]|uniref:VWA domain-containing protein n=1 Tax=Phytohabitans maris TaxID=3071409 RepID=A0ABU0ZBY6_9ACTN|nr:VWA domain-containing protein [Phytohabitans sp. ZYX-F-186]MDQ7903842.1 VWA domain-containing protein [Phytohabitans sp. ZYX-F-186]
MSLTWPWALTALLAFPALLGYRWWVRRRRRRETVRVSSVTLIRAALPGRSLWRRRVPIWLFAAGLVVLAGGAARPQASVPVPSNSAAILLAIDVSASMCSTDVPPNRLSAAQEAAKKFVEELDEGTRIGLVTFSGIAGLLVEPTDDKDALIAAIDDLKTSRGTAIGQAILTSVDAIAEFNPDVPPTGVEVPPATGDADEYQPDTIVVLTDGRNTQGVDPVTAAGEAAARRLRVYTIGFGTTEPAPSVCTREQISGDAAFWGDGSRGPFGGFGGRGRYMQADEGTLTEVADLTGGEYFQAEDADALTEVLLDLPDSITLQRENVEITAWFALAGALLVLAGVGLAQWWQRAVAVPPPVLAPAVSPPAAPPPAAPAAPSSHRQPGVGPKDDAPPPAAPSSDRRLGVGPEDDAVWKRG